MTEAKNRFGALIDRVRAGEAIIILDRGTPVARLEPVAASPAQVGRRERLERSGIARLGSASPPIDLIRLEPPSLKRRGSGVAVLLDERRTTR